MRTFLVMNLKIILEEQRMQSLLFIESDALLHTNNVKLHQLDEHAIHEAWPGGGLCNDAAMQ